MHSQQKLSIRKTIRILAIILAAYVLLSMGAVVIINSAIFGRTEFDVYDLQLTYDDIDSGVYPRSEFLFDSNGNMLQGYLYGAANTQGLILIAHGIENGADGFLPEIMYFVDRGWRVFAFDGTGSRRSEGSGIKGLPQTKLDVAAAIDYINAEPELKNLPLCLLGHSMGGYAVTAVLGGREDIAAVVSLSGFNSPLDVMYETARKEAGFLAGMVRPFLQLYQWMLFGDDADSSAVDAINASDVPVLLIFGAEDDIIDPSSVGLYALRNEITNPNFSYIAVDKANRSNHTDMLRTDEAAEYAFQKREELDALFAEYGNDIPEEVFSQFYQTADRRLMHRLDSEIMDLIDVFFLESL